MFKKSVDQKNNKISYNHSNGQSITISPNKGGIVNELILLNQLGHQYSVIDGYKEEINITEAYKGALLFPFPNRINEGKYNFKGQDYQLPINEDRIGGNNQIIKHALHGLLYQKEWTLVSENIDQNEVTINLTYDYDAEETAYPFHFKVNITYCLSALNNELVISTKVINTSDLNIPMAYGFHPYIKMNDKAVDELTISFPTSLKLDLSEKAIPIGTKNMFNAFSKPKSLNNVNFDDCFELEPKEDNLFSVTLSDATSQLEIWQQTGKSKLNYLQIYTPEHRKSIAIEPMTSSIDSFNNKHGLIEMIPKETISSSFGIKLI